MTPALALGLTGLSVLDSTSFGTLLIPGMADRPEPQRGD